MDTEDKQFKILNKITTKSGIEKITVDKSCLKKYISRLKNSAEFDTNMLLSVMAYDSSEDIEISYNLFSEKLNTYIVVSTILDRNNPVCDTVTDMYKSAEFDEREIYDMFGVYFEGHKNLKRILMSDFAVGNPLIKEKTNEGQV